MIEPCYETAHQMGSYSPIVILLLLGFFPIVGISLIALGIFTAYVSVVHDGYPFFVAFVFLFFVMVIAAFFLILGWCS